MVGHLIFVMKTTRNSGSLFEPLEDSVHLKLIPLSLVMINVLQLNVSCFCFGSLGIVDTVAIADSQYNVPSKLLTLLRT